MSTLKLPISGFVLEQAHANIDTLWGPYDSLPLALEAIPVSKRKAGFKFGVTSGNTIIEYTFETDGATTATECVLKKNDYYSKNDIDGKVGNMQNLSTTEKSSLVGAINELKQGLDGKASTSALADGLAGKQGTISDLEAIRSGAGKGATSVQGVKMEGDDDPLTPDVDGVVTIPQPEIPDSVTSVIANNELVFQTPDGQSVKGKVGVTTGADGLLHLTLTDEEGHTYSSPIAGLRVVGNALQYSNDGETWVTVQTFGKLAIKYVQASDPATGDEGDLALIGTTNAYVLKVYVGGSWVSVCDFGTLDLTSDGITMAGENKTLTQKMAEIPDIANSNTDSDFDIIDANGNVLSRHSEGHFKTKNFDSRDVEKIKQNTGISKYDEFDVENDYAVDDVVLYGGLLYKFTSVHTAGAWDDNDVEQTTVIDELNIDVKPPVTTEHPVDVVGGVSDFDLSDQSGNVLARMSDGHFKTLHFDSRYVNTTVRPIKKCVFMGDSITHGVYSYFNNDTHDDTNRYNGFDLNPKGDASFRNLSNQSVIEAATAYQGIHYYFGKMMCCDVVNLARRGSGFVHDGRSGGTFCDLIFGNANKTSSGISAYDFTDVDLVCVFFGINDYINNKVLTTCVGELERGVREILRENPLCKIVIFSPYNAWGQVSQGGDYLGDTLYGNESTNYALGAAAVSGGYTLQAFVDAIDTKCNELGIQHVPLSKSNVCNRINIKDIMIDGLHPSKESYLMLAAEIYGKVNYGN